MGQDKAHGHNYERSKETKALHFVCFCFPVTSTQKEWLNPLPGMNSEKAMMTMASYCSPNRSKINKSDGKHENAEWSDKPAQSP